MTDEQFAKLGAWYRSQFELRTAAIEAGDGRIDWLNPGTRVSLTEIRSYAEIIFGIEMTAQETIDWLHYINKPKGKT